MNEKVLLAAFLNGVRGEHFRLLLNGKPLATLLEAMKRENMYIPIETINDKIYSKEDNPRKVDQG